MTPSNITLHKQSKQLELRYAGASTANSSERIGTEETYRLSCEFLRVHSPSAEVKGHGHRQEVLQYGKADVGITNITPCGNYAIQLSFTDGHDTGIYSWDYLYSLCQNQESMWQEYLERLHAAGKSREPDTQVVQIF